MRARRDSLWHWVLALSVAAALGYVLALAYVAPEQAEARRSYTVSESVSVAWERDRRYEVEHALADTVQALQACREDKAVVEASR